MRIEAIAIGENAPEDINVIIEVPVGGEPIKYEMEKESGALVVDRFLYTSMRYPGNYGFVPHTPIGRRRPYRCHRFKYSSHYTGCGNELSSNRRPNDD